MKKIVIFMLFAFSLNAHPWSSDHQKSLIEKASQEVPLLSTYPSFQYPNKSYQQILKLYPEEKVLIFGYGSLMNAQSAERTVSIEAVHSMEPALAFGFKRIFNYKASNVSRWGPSIEENEKAMLNIEPTTTYRQIINGVVMQVSAKDLELLIQREIGYDLVPILIANWDDAVAENPTRVKIAYTFLVPDELRQGVDYTQTMFYPVRGYLHAAQEGAAAFGPDFLNFWNSTTYLGNGITPINNWNEETFSGILDSREP